MAAPLPFRRRIVGSLRTALLLAVGLSHYLLFFLLWLPRGAEARRRLAMRHGGIWARNLCRVMRIRVITRGPAPPPGALYAPNHLGYADIPIIMGVAPCTVMTRAEFATGPIIATMIRAADIPMIRRTQSRDLAAVATVVSDRLRSGYGLCVFLEGTSTGGDRVLPFKTPVIDGAIQAGASIVPIGIRWKVPSGVELAEEVAYWKDHEFWPHLLGFMSLPPLTVEVHFGAAVGTAGRDRKELATELRRAVCELAELPPLNAAT